jgi:peptidoglycan biosynthesis protein MviN/MurJ (putative lipid II flippase)
MALASGAANLALSLLLAAPFGPLGVAIGTLIPAILESVFLVMPYTTRVLGIGPGRLVGQAILPAIAPALPSGVVLYIAQGAVHPTSWPALGAVAIIGALTYLAIYLRFGAGPLEAAAYRRVVADIRQRLDATRRRISATAARAE